MLNIIGTLYDLYSSSKPEGMLYFINYELMSYILVSIAKKLLIMLDVGLTYYFFRFDYCIIVVIY